MSEERLGQSEQDNATANPRGRRPFRATPHDVPDEREAAERGYDEREMTQERDLNEEERLEMFRDSLDQSVLPDLPPMPGYHVCWLSTSNPRDTIQWRLRLGYELIRIEDTPGWEGVGLKTGDYQGVVGVNEMVAARIPLSLYNRYMREVHHTKPLDEEEKMRVRTEMLKEQAESMGSSVQEGDGTAQIVQRARPMPEFLS